MKDKEGDTWTNADGSVSTLVDNGDGSLGTLTTGCPNPGPVYHNPHGEVPIPPPTVAQLNDRLRTTGLGGRDE